MNLNEYIKQIEEEFDKELGRLVCDCKQVKDECPRANVFKAFIKDQITKALANQREQIKQGLMDTYQQHTECDSFINEALNIKELQD